MPVFTTAKHTKEDQEKSVKETGRQTAKKIPLLKMKGSKRQSGRIPRPPHPPLRREAGIQDFGSVSESRFHLPSLLPQLLIPDSSLESHLEASRRSTFSPPAPD